MNPGLKAVSVRTAAADPALTARVLTRVPLHYEEGPDSGLDRPAFVRAGSSLAWSAGGIVVFQDDVNFLAVFDPVTRRTRAITLPAGARGLRQFDDLRGNKKHRLDLEACVALQDGGETILLGFGSGSHRRREQLLVLRALAGAQPQVSLFHAAGLYAALRDREEFAGSDLNIEGAVEVGDRVRLFSRGNGAVRGGRVPVNATCDLDRAALLAYLRSPESAATPTPGAVIQYRLGDIDGIALGFTDAANWQGTILYSAAAESSPDASRDGPVAGSAIGVMDSGGTTRWAPLTEEAGGRFSGKVEGLAPGCGGTPELFAVLDGDDARAAAELCTIELAGPWVGAPQG